MRAPKYAFVLVAVLLGALVFAACGDDDDDSGGDTTPTATSEAAEPTNPATTTPADGEGEAEVHVELADFMIDLDRDTVPAGMVKFEITNDGENEHEFVVIKTDLAEDELPMTDEATVDEQQVDIVGEVEGIPVGEDSEGEFDLEPGSYVLICNLPAHYQQGMHTSFTVT